MAGRRPAPDDNGPERMRWSRTDTLALLAVTLLAGAIRLARVADPGEVIFDETYYAKD
ncbi:MAG: hypothetical protein H0V60_09820, partial [Actinobacteria bacterium]|nr:hypothetical protein [Actinomycetota bacterium]